MPRRKSWAVALILLFILLFGLAGARSSDAAPPLDRLNLPSGFKAELYAEVEGARFMTVVDPLNTVFVGTLGPEVYAVVDDNRDGHADRVVPVYQGERNANGVAWKDGFLYVGEQHRVVRLRGESIEAIAAAEPQTVFEPLPDNSHHGRRVVGFGPDERLYVAVGTPCNVCEPQGLESTIVRLGPDGSGPPEIFASGIRNAMGFDFQPTTGEMYFTDNGADYMGDNSPPEELNHAPKPGLFFGFPYFGGGADRTPQFKDKDPPRPVTMPVATFSAHVAPLGMHFYRGAMFPKAFKGDVFVAQHGSWNRQTPDGYRVVRVRFDAAGKPKGVQVFADGFLQRDGAWGRPVDIKELADGSLLVSDDQAGAIYRITRKGR